MKYGKVRDLNFPKLEYSFISIVNRPKQRKNLPSESNVDSVRWKLWEFLESQVTSLGEIWIH